MTLELPVSREGEIDHRDVVSGGARRQGRPQGRRLRPARAGTVTIDTRGGAETPSASPARDRTNERETRS